jgi:hypothetical protein
MDRGFHVPLRVGHSSAISVFTTRVHPFAPDIGHGLAPLCLLISGYPLSTIEAVEYQKLKPQDWPIARGAVISED